MTANGGAEPNAAQAPETIQPDVPITTAADIFSYGILLLELTSQHPAARGRWSLPRSGWKCRCVMHDA